MRPAFFLVSPQDDAPDCEFVLKTVTWDKDANDFDKSVGMRLTNGKIQLNNLQVVAVGGRKSLAEAFGHIPIQNCEFVAPAGQLLFMQTSRSAPGRAKVFNLMQTDASNFAFGAVGHLATAILKDRDRQNMVAEAAEDNRRLNYNNHHAPLPPRPAGAQPQPMQPAAGPANSMGVGYYYKKLMNATYNPSVIAKKLSVYDEGIKEKTVVRIVPGAANFNGIKLGPTVTGSAICLYIKQHYGI
jgi:hypothetical protein